MSVPHPLRRHFLALLATAGLATAFCTSASAQALDTVRLAQNLSPISGVVIVAKTLVFGIDVPGYASLLVSILFLGGIQLLGIGIIGQYLGRVYAEIKQRPVYIVRRTFGGR